MKQVMTFNDKILFFLLIAFSLASFLLVKNLIFANPFEGGKVKIYVNGVERSSYLLKQKRKAQIKGYMGVSTFEILEGKVRMIKSPCPNKNCIMQGWIKYPGEQIICAPNRVVIKVEGEEKIDALNR